MPNGSAVDSEKYIYKLKWLNYLNLYLIEQSKRDEPVCLVGDFNIALEEKDIFNAKRFNNGIMATHKEREALKGGK